MDTDESTFTYLILCDLGYCHNIGMEAWGKIVPVKCRIIDIPTLVVYGLRSIEVHHVDSSFIVQLVRSGELSCSKIPEGINGNGRP